MEPIAVPNAFVMEAAALVYIDRDDVAYVVYVMFIGIVANI